MAKTNNKQGKSGPNGPEKQALVVQLAALGLFGYLVVTDSISFNTVDVGTGFGLLLLALAGGVDPGTWVKLITTIVERFFGGGRNGKG